MKTKKILLAIFLLLLVSLGFYLFRRSRPEEVVEEKKATLPINTIPVSQRPYVALLPDATGRNITLFLDNTTFRGSVEYELVYDAGEKQEGAFGRVDLGKESLPVEKKILLGSQSAGGKITYHEGVTGGSLTLTYDSHRLKESFNFTRFNPQSPELSAPDGKFTALFPKTALSKGEVIIIMKSFGPISSFSGELVSGPYTVQTADNTLPSSVTFSVSSDQEGLSVLAYKDGTWRAAPSRREGSTLILDNPSSTDFVLVKN